MSGEALAKTAYDAYGEYTHWENHLGKPMPTWPELPPRIKGAWAASVRAVVAEVQK